MTQHSDIENDRFTMGLALVDLLPVIFFGGAAVLISLLLKSKMFMLGAILCTLAGLGKVAWKILLARKEEDIQILFHQFRILMPAGFLLIIISLIACRDRINMTRLLAAIISFPSNVCFLVGIVGMVMMIVFAKRLDPNDVKANWIEQITNSIAQAAFFFGILFAML